MRFFRQSVLQWIIVLAFVHLGASTPTIPPSPSPLITFSPNVPPTNGEPTREPTMAPSVNPLPNPIPLPTESAPPTLVPTISPFSTLPPTPLADDVQAVKTTYLVAGVGSTAAFVFTGIGIVLLLRRNKESKNGPSLSYPQMKALVATDGHLEQSLRSAEQVLLQSGSAAAPFDMVRVVSQLLGMGITISDIVVALDDVRNTIATHFSEDDSTAVREARLRDFCKKLKPFKKGVDRYAVFLSHSQLENEWARLMARTIGHQIDGDVFCDLDAGLENLRNLGDILSKSGNLVVLLSEKSVTSPWCVLEVILARQHGVKMVPAVLGQFAYDRLDATKKVLQGLSP